MAGQPEAEAVNVQNRRIVNLICVQIVAIVNLLALAGCATTERLVEIKVPVPVECREKEPARPAMDTETLSQTSRIDEQSRAMRAEIEAREGYEDRLRTALRNCIAPVQP